MSTVDNFRFKLEQRRIERENSLRKLETEKPPRENLLSNESKKLALSSELKTDIEKALIKILSDPLVDLPINSEDLLYQLKLSTGNFRLTSDLLNGILLKLSTAYKLIKVREVNSKRKNCDVSTKQLSVLSTDLEKISVYQKKIFNEQVADEDIDRISHKYFGKFGKDVAKLTNTMYQKHNFVEFLEKLLAQPSALEYESRKVRLELNELLMAPTVIENIEMERFKSIKSHVQEYCPYGTKDECFRNHYNKNILHKRCEKIHFKRILKSHTDISLGDCSFLNTCYNINNCKYIHYEVDMDDVDEEITFHAHHLNNTMMLQNYPPQWVQCDLRTFDMEVLGKFAVIMADPPWDIHMELPYGTMADEEMKKLDIPSLQDDGYIFLWVTGRAMELGRECLKEWNYERVDELIWVKTNQLQRIIRTGRTGHWLNHGKEHCLIGVKGKPDPRLFNTGIDCDVIVAEVRATSHKPDEVYGLIERLSPGTRKVELFGRPHNVKHNWITLGNQLDGARLLEPEVVNRFKAKYPDGNCMAKVTSKD